jgi:hypothetical protein
MHRPGNAREPCPTTGTLNLARGAHSAFQADTLRRRTPSHAAIARLPRHCPAR